LHGWHREVVLDDVTTLGGTPVLLVIVILLVAELLEEGLTNAAEDFGRAERCVTVVAPIFLGDRFEGLEHACEVDHGIRLDALVDRGGFEFVGH
jgi:hypothetical protein